MNSVTLDYQSPAEVPPPEGVYQCGTLRYTLFGLIMVFVWLLWGDFIFTLLDGCVPNVLPLKLNDMGANDTVNQVLNRTLSSLVVFLFAPMVSVASDRHRGPWGRRIPYLFWSTPFVGLFMILMGCHENLVNVVMGHSDHLTFAMHIGSWHPTISRTAIALWIFAAIFAAFDFANIFVNTVYWYLFNDVVPPQFMSRFLAIFRIVGSAAGMLYNRLIFPHALDHFRLIFVLAGIAYVIGFMLMCIFVHEGEYPPPEPITEEKTNIIASSVMMTKVFFQQCFTHRFYWYFFLMNACDALAGQIGTFGNLRNRNSLHLSLTEIGLVNYYVGFVSMFLQFPAGWASDKWGPIRVSVICRWVMLVGAFGQVIWIFKDFGEQGNLHLMYFFAFAFMPFGVLGDAAGIPMYMKLLPRDRYGQFCSANAMFRSFLNIFGSVAAAFFMQWLANHETIKDWHYRYNIVWTLAFQIPGLVFMMLLFKDWKQMGGEKHYTPP